MHIPAWSKLVVILLTLGYLFAPGVAHHWQVARDPHFVPFDAVLNIPAFFKFDPRDPVPTTLLKEYHLDTMSPPLYKASLILGAHLTDVRAFQLVLMYLSYALFVALLGRMAWLLGGATLSFAVILFALTAWIFIGLGFIGGAARMYAYPAMAVVLYALLRDRPWLLVFTTIIGAALYPLIALIAGLCLAGWLLLPIYSRQGVVAQWSPRRRLITLALTGFIAVGCLMPILIDGQAYGRRLVAADVVNYPEAGSAGNYRPYDRQPYPLFGKETLTYYLGPMYSHGDPLVPQLNLHRNLTTTGALGALAAIGLAMLVVIIAGLRKILQSPQRAAAIRVGGFFLACTALHIISWLAAPYLYVPTRYFMFSLPFIITFLFPWALVALVGGTPRGRCIFLAVVALYAAALGTRGNVDFDKGSIVAKPARPLFAAIAALPKTSLIAGWPWGEIKNLEYATRRNVFLTAELHQVLHLGFVENMRQRMDASFEAYFAVDTAPLRRLRDQFGVTHFLVEARHFTDPKTPPKYFAPWHKRIAPRLAEVRSNAYLMNQSLHRSAALFNDNGLILLDLARLP